MSSFRDLALQVLTLTLPGVSPPTRSASKHDHAQNTFCHRGNKTSKYGLVLLGPVLMCWIRRMMNTAGVLYDHMGVGARETAIHIAHEELTAE